MQTNREIFQKNSKNPDLKRMVKFRKISPRLENILPSLRKCYQIPKNRDGEIKILIRFRKSKKSMQSPKNLAKD